MVSTTAGHTTTLGEKQLHIATAIIANARQRGLGDAGARVGLITALTESKLKMYANGDYPESLNYPHDAVGYDHDSLNFFQQRIQGSWGGTGTQSEKIRNLMNLDWAIAAFFNRLQGLDGKNGRRDWTKMTPGQAAQAVQVSQFPDRYDEWVPAADLLLKTYPEGG